jgi:hypothetical protein
MTEELIPEDASPKARTVGLVVEALEDEVLVYDKDAHRAHCLNGAAALVWRMADGQTPVSEMVAALPTVGSPAVDSVVWMALDRLARAKLLDGEVAFPEGRDSYSRKEMLRILGRAAGMALVLPAVSSVAAPLAAQAASCITNKQCKKLRPNNCTGLPICGRPNKCCLRKRKKKKWVCRSRNC